MNGIISNVTRRALLKTSGALAGGVLAGMPLSQVIWAAEGRVLKVRMNLDMTSLDPAHYVSDREVDVMHCLYSKLTRYKPGSQWGWELEAAEKIEQVDPTHIRFHLKKGIKFSGGYGEINAKDFKFSVERTMPIPVWGPLDHVEIEDDYTGVIVFKTPYEPVWWLPLPHASGQILSEAAVRKVVKDGGSFGMKPPAFSGPYMLAEWKANEFTLLTRNPEWSGPKPGFDEIRILPIGDDKAAERAYQAGDVDFTFISPESVSNFKSNPPPDTKIEVMPSIDYDWLGLNVDHPKLKDINVRKAVQWAINVPQILDAAYAGEAKVATGTIAPGLVGHRETALIPPEGDLAKAKVFLEKAGVSDLKLTIDCLNDSTSTTIAQVIQAQLSQIGIAVEVNAQNSGSFWTLGMESEGDRWKDLQLILNGYSGLPDPQYETAWFTTAQVGVWNWERFRSDRFDELEAKAVAVADPNERAKFYYEMQDIMEDSGGYRFLTHAPRPIMSRTTKMQAVTRPDGTPLYLDFKPSSA
ncbi:ABC transporter substrate-binding protein [Mesorhizobium sp. YC-39]|uniref:ABC transporter substrate-binding protein n=1 Tax=unclassified Mesorhizobium TaxID=325217 RepID=UPI0021E77F1B|nr:MULTISPECIES: ABC transporter substrate-binding protein [unclassified Mesorhizobium]MCV3211517.1 ABC transporter substrate-binding protein [Mesorhizobium sp. YC-2]MCV3233285.1 ABC transporter substrate-binding protein [Mesorhizobium sp. YC-39]